MSMAMTTPRTISAGELLRFDAGRRAPRPTPRRSPRATSAGPASSTTPRTCTSRPAQVHLRPEPAVDVPDVRDVPAPRLAPRPSTGPAARPVSRPVSHDGLRPSAQRRPVARRAAPLRLTHRGQTLLRAAAALALVGVLTTLVLAARGPGSAAEAPAAAPVVEAVTVLPGDTLWAIAQRIAPGEDPRDVVHRIRELNGLATSSLQAGQELFVPTT